MSKYLIFTLFLMGTLLGTARAAPPEYETAYQKAREAYYRFRGNEQKEKFRHNWQNLAEKFEKIAEKYTDSPRAPDALYTAGRLYHDLYLISRVTEDLDKSIELFRRLVNKFPENHLADDAQLYIALRWVEFDKKPEDARKELRYLVEQFPEGDVTPKARRMLEDLGEQPKEEKAPPPREKKTPPEKKKVAPAKPVLEKVRHWSNPEYTRIALYTRAKARYKVGKLAADRQKKLPHRLYIDVLEAKAGSDLAESIKVEDSVVRNIRCAEREGGFIRVVVDLDEDRPHRVFPMNDPARVVVDITKTEDKIAKVIGKKTAKKPPAPKPPKKKVPKGTPEGAAKPAAKTAVKELKKKSKPGESLSMLVGLKVKRIVIDPGHGGRDPGAIGPKGTLEKEMVLDIARRVKKLLKKKLKVEVLLTRNSDRFMALEARTGYANKKKADLFVSIHLNAHRNRKFRGVETFYLDLTNDRYSIKLAARENATSEKSISDLEFILQDLALKSHVDDSILLSRHIQKAMVGKLRRKYKRVKNLGVKSALFYVLIGARMPSILIEGSFLTNPMEEKRIRTKSYRQRLAEGIADGIKRFVDEREKLLEP
jgi:N-acetylmuramoyl-L-alanine amidase